MVCWPKLFNQEC